MSELSEVKLNVCPSDQILSSSFLGGVGIHWDDNHVRTLHSER